MSKISCTINHLLHKPIPFTCKVVRINWCSPIAIWWLVFFKIKSSFFLKALKHSKVSDIHTVTIGKITYLKSCNYFGNDSICTTILIYKGKRRPL